MKEKVIFIIILFILISNCQRQEVIKTHGLAYLEKRQKLMIINESNKNDTYKILGHPATKGLKNDNLWIYIERTLTRGKFLKLGRNLTKKNNVLVLEFNDYGVLVDKKFFDKENMQKIEFTKAITENDIKKENFIYSFLTSVRQKMETKKK
tara:strand:- start:344 stop:796 length:453 start_codon:yes stop_codon:yes gene_type:complete